MLEEYFSYFQTHTVLS